MDNTATCRSCPEWQEPDPTSNLTASWITNPIKCRDVDCWSNAWYTTITHSCLADTTNWVCPDDTWTKCTGTNQNKCIKCIDPSLTANANTCKCS